MTPQKILDKDKVYQVPRQPRVPYLYPGLGLRVLLKCWLPRDPVEELCPRKYVTLDGMGVLFLSFLSVSVRLFTFFPLFVVMATFECENDDKNKNKIGQNRLCLSAWEITGWSPRVSCVAFCAVNLQSRRHAPPSAWPVSMGKQVWRRAFKYWREHVDSDPNIKSIWNLSLYLMLRLNIINGRCLMEDPKSIRITKVSVRSASQRKISLISIWNKRGASQDLQW